MSIKTNAREAIVAARLKAPTTVLVCKECQTGRELRRRLKGEVKASGRKRELRVVACACLDVCPKRGSAAIVAAAGSAARCVVVDEDAVIDGAFVRTLLHERVGDAVAHEHRRLDRLLLDHRG